MMDPTIKPVVESSLHYLISGLAFLGGLILGGAIGLLGGYIKGRWDRDNERAVVLLDKEQKEAA